MFFNPCKKCLVTPCCIKNKSDCELLYKFLEKRNKWKKIFFIPVNFFLVAVKAIGIMTAAALVLLIATALVAFILSSLK